MSGNGTGGFGAAAVAASVLTSVMPRNLEPNRAYCGDCRGSGFDKITRPGNRHARRCQRCRGKGFTTVGRTKR